MTSTIGTLLATNRTCFYYSCQIFRQLFEVAISHLMSAASVYTTSLHRAPTLPPSRRKNLKTRMRYVEVCEKTRFCQLWFIVGVKASLELLQKCVKQRGNGTKMKFDLYFLKFCLLNSNAVKFHIFTKKYIFSQQPRGRI